MTALRLGDVCMLVVLLLQADKAAQAQGDALPLGFHHARRVLCVGEGNFSFARALVRLFDGDGSSLVATAYDSEEQTQLKYEVSCQRGTACGTAPAWWWQGPLAQCRGRLVGSHAPAQACGQMADVPAHAPQRLRRPDAIRWEVLRCHPLRLRGVEDAQVRSRPPPLPAKGAITAMPDVSAAFGT